MALQRLHTFETVFSGVKDEGEIVCLVAPTKQGKTELAKAILRTNIHKFDYVFLITSGSSHRQYMNYFFPSQVIIVDGSGKKDVANAFQSFCLQMQSLRTHQENNNMEPFKILTMFDDVSSGLGMIENFTKTRHYNMSVLMLTHSISDLTTAQRDQVTHWFLNQTLRFGSYKPVNAIMTQFQNFLQTRPHNSHFNYLLWMDKNPEQCFTIRLDPNDIELNKNFMLPANNFSFEIRRIIRYVSKIKEVKEQVKEQVMELFQ